MTEKLIRIPLREAYTFGTEKGLSKEVSEIRSMEIEWDRSYTSSVRKGRLVRLFRENGLLDEFINTIWPSGKTEAGEKHVQNILRIAANYDDFLSGNSSDENEGSNNDSEYLEFALESHLRDFLAKNIEKIETGLRLASNEERSGIEYPVDSSRIDLLAIDNKDRYVVIELKLSQGRNKALGQLLYYMGWVDENLENPPCRGVIVANEISRELEIAVSRTPDVSLFKYNMSFSIEPVKSA